MRKGVAEVKNKMTRAEKAEMRRAIRRERRGQNKTGVASVTDEAKSFGRGLGRVVSGYDFVVVVLVVLLGLGDQVRFVELRNSVKSLSAAIVLPEVS